MKTYSNKEAFMKVLSKGKEKKNIHLEASVKGLAMKVEPVTVILQRI